MIHIKDDLIHIGSYIMDSKYIYKITKIDITDVVTTTNYKETMDYIEAIKKYRNYINVFKQQYNIGDTLSKKYYAVKRYRINAHSLQKMNGKSEKEFMCASYFTLLDDEYIGRLIKTLITYNDLLQESKSLNPNKDSTLK